MIPVQTLTVVAQLALLSVLAFFAASTTNTLIAGAIKPERKLVLTEPEPVVSVAPEQPITHYAVIADRSVFYEPKAPEPAPVAPSKPTLPPLKAKLIGTAPGSGGADSWAILIDETSKKQELFRIGDSLQGRTLSEVEWDRVVLKHDAGEDELRIVEPTSKEAPSRTTTTASSAGPSAEGIEKISDTSYVIDKAEVDKSMENLNQLFTQIRAVPHFQNGKAAGFRLFAIRKGSIFENLGLKNGDIVTSINGNELTDPVRAMGLLQELKEERQVALDLTRNREPVGMNYEVR